MGTSQHITEKFKNCIFLKNNISKEIKKYDYVENISVWIKRDDVICIQWFGLNEEDFLNFLLKYSWDQNIINLKLII